MKQTVYITRNGRNDQSSTGTNDTFYNVHRAKPSKARDYDDASGKWTNTFHYLCAERWEEFSGLSMEPGAGPIAVEFTIRRLKRGEVV